MPVNVEKPHEIYIGNPARMVVTGPGQTRFDRLAALAAASASSRRRTDELIALAKRGLPAMYRRGKFVHTMRAVKHGIRPEGTSLRYTANCALGLAQLPLAEQRGILNGGTANELAHLCAAEAEFSTDPGAVALAAWTAAEAAGYFAEPLYRRLLELLRSGKPVMTVDCSWTLIAAVAGRDIGDTRELTKLARDRLVEGQGPHGLFPHVLPAKASGRLRAHIGCFADQVYSTQGLSRVSLVDRDDKALACANASGGAICTLQGPAGQWWWHYDVRTGAVVEGYPVYSVHQHAMAPMALLDLWEAGGDNHLEALALGLNWLDTHPEVDAPLVREEKNVIWRKAARREPFKAVRKISAVTTALRPGLLTPGLDAVFPPSRIDRECRPYEFGWLLYAWLSGGHVAAMRHGGADHAK